MKSKLVCIQKPGVYHNTFNPSPSIHCFSCTLSFPVPPKSMLGDFVEYRVGRDCGTDTWAKFIEKLPFCPNFCKNFVALFD